VSNLQRERTPSVKGPHLNSVSLTTEKKIRIFGEYPRISIQCYTPKAQFWFLDYFVGFWVLSIFIILIFYILMSYPVLRYFGYSKPLDKTCRFYLTMVVYFTCVFLKVYYCPYREHYWLFVPVTTSSIILSIAVVTFGYFLISYFTRVFEVRVAPLFLQIGITRILTKLSVVVVFLFFFFFLKT